MKKNVIFWWTPEQQATFKTLMQRLYEATILILPNGMDDFVVYCDVSMIGFGIILMQRVT